MRPSSASTKSSIEVASLACALNHRGHAREYVLDPMVEFRNQQVSVLLRLPSGGDVLRRLANQDGQEGPVTESEPANEQVDALIDEEKAL